MRNLRTIAFILMITLSFTSCKKEHTTLSGETEFLIGTWHPTTPNQRIYKISFDKKGCYIEYKKERNNYMKYGIMTINEKKSYNGDFTYKEIKIFNLNKKDRHLGGLRIKQYEVNNEYNFNQISITINPINLYYIDSQLLVYTLDFKKQ